MSEWITRESALKEKKKTRLEKDRSPLEVLGYKGPSSPRWQNTVATETQSAEQWRFEK